MEIVFRARTQSTCRTRRRRGWRRAGGRRPASIRRPPDRDRPAERPETRGLYLDRRHAVGQGRARMAPLAIAQAVVKHLPPSDLVEAAEVLPPGFINFRLSPRWLAHLVESHRVRRHGVWEFDLGHGRTCQVEFISANPTGPLHMGSARNAVLGDAVASVLEAAGLAGAARILPERRRHADADVRRDTVSPLQAGFRRGRAARPDPLPGRVHGRARAARSAKSTATAS